MTEAEDYPTDYLNDPDYAPKHRRRLPGWYIRLREWLLREDDK